MKRLRSALTAAVLGLVLTACGNAGQTYTEYTQAVLDCTYHGNTAAYMQLTDASQEEADGVYADEIGYVSDLLCYNAAVDREHISEETAAGYDELAKALLDRTQYTVEPAVRSGERYNITVKAQPMDFWEISLPGLQNAYQQEFSERFYRAPADSEELFALEAEWGERALEVLTPYLEEITYGETQTVVIGVTADAQGHYVVSEADWLAVDAAILLSPTV